MQGVCLASVGRVQIKGFVEETDTVLFHIAKKPQYMDEDGEIHDVDENYDPKIHKLVYDGSLKVEVSE